MSDREEKECRVLMVSSVLDSNNERLVVVGEKRTDGFVDIINAFDGDKANDIWESISVKNRSIAGGIEMPPNW